MASNNQPFELGFLNDFDDLVNLSEMVAETSEASKDQQNESATRENNTCTCTCACSESVTSKNNTCMCTCRICNLISAEKSTFQHEK